MKDGQADADAEAKVEVHRVLVQRGHGTIARRPHVEDVGLDQDWVENHGEDQAEEAADHCPKWQDHTGHDIRHIPAPASGHGW